MPVWLNRLHDFPKNHYVLVKKEVSFLQCRASVVVCRDCALNQGAIILNNLVPLRRFETVSDPPRLLPPLLLHNGSFQEISLSLDIYKHVKKLVK